MVPEPGAGAPTRRVSRDASLSVGCGNFRHGRHGHGSLQMTGSASRGPWASLRRSP
jgi:hypothetical protein